MAFSVVELSPTLFHLQSGANSGLIRAGDQAIVIDAGLDDDTGKKIRKTLESMNLTLSALILTHGHADHFGGAAYLRKVLPPFRVYAPVLEAAFIENPALEGIFLGAGALPFDTLMGKFTLAQPCKVDAFLPMGSIRIAGVDLEVVDSAGHSPGQVAIRADSVLFSADAFLPVETIQKYPIPFTVHIGKALAVLDRLESETGALFAPGHGSHLSEPRAVIQANRAALLRVLDKVSSVIHDAPIDEAALTQKVGAALGDPLASPVSYYLARATIQAALVYLYEQKQIRWVSLDGKLLWSTV